MDAQALNWQEVLHRRSGRWAHCPVIYRQSVDSTNTLAARLVPDQAPPGAVLVTDYQYAGRGRLARRWHVEPYSALTATVVLGALSVPWTAPLACGLAVLQALEAVGVPAALKWPNDVLVAGKKCGGILIESHLVAAERWLLAGIGLNVRSIDPSLADSATYLDAHLAGPVRREDLLVALLSRLDVWCVRAEQEPGALRQAWRAHLVTLGQQVTVRAAAETFQGLARDVADDGGLLVETADGTVRIVQAGDVTLSAAAHLG